MIVELPTILYAVIAALSPLAFSATVVVLKSDRGRVNGALFTIGFVCAEAVVVIIGLLVDSMSISRPRSRSTLASVLGLAAGVALLAVAAALRRRPATPAPAAAPSRRTSRLLRRMERLGPVQAVAAGLALGVGGPKRIAMTLLAAATISATVGRMSIQQIGLAGIFVVVACSLVWAPALVYLTAGRAGLDRLQSLEAGVMAHRRQAGYYGSLALGAVLLVSALVSLVR